MSTTFRPDAAVARHSAILRARHAAHRSPTAHCPDCLFRRPTVAAIGTRLAASVPLG